jgi:futalosine hydrolase
MLLNKLREAGRPGRVLFAIAAPVEVQAVLHALGSHASVPALWACECVTSEVEVLHVGVSKANAAGGVAQWLAGQRERYGLVLNVGIAGALPEADGSGYRSHVGETVVATHCDFSDEGILTDDGYRDVAEIGFPLDPRSRSTFACDPLALEVFRPIVSRVGVITAVSTCSATDELARAIARRTPALCEAMEGAAIGLVCQRLLQPMIEVRAISNLTGSRTHQAWDINAALRALRGVLQRLAPS